MRAYNIDFAAVTLTPARLVKITRIDGTILRIAEADESITVSGNVFAPLPGCDISAIKHIINGEMPSMQINFAHSVGGTIDTEDLNHGVWDGATVQVYKIDRNSISTLGDPAFTGTIQVVTLSPVGSAGSFDCRGLAAQAETVIQTRQPMCRTDLFSSLCQLVETDWDHTGTVGTPVDQFNFPVSGLASPPADGWFNQGVLLTASGFRAKIANWVQSTLTITTYQAVCMTRLTAGEGITLYPGCDFRAVTCRTKFNNKINFQAEDHFLGINSIVGV